MLNRPKPLGGWRRRKQPASAIITEYNLARFQEWCCRGCRSVRFGSLLTIVFSRLLYLLLVEGCPYAAFASLHFAHELHETPAVGVPYKVLTFEDPNDDENLGKQTSLSSE